MGDINRLLAGDYSERPDIYDGKTQEQIEAELAEFYAQQDALQGQMVGSGLETSGAGFGGGGAVSGGFRLKPPMASEELQIPEFELPGAVASDESDVGYWDRWKTKMFLSNPVDQVAGLKSLGYDAGYSSSAGQPFTVGKDGKRRVLDPVGLGINEGPLHLRNIGEAASELAENVDLGPELLAKDPRTAGIAGGLTSLIRQAGREAFFPDTNFDTSQFVIDNAAPQAGPALQGVSKGVKAAGRGIRQGIGQATAGAAGAVSSLGQKAQATGLWQKAGQLLSRLPDMLMNENALARNLGASDAQLNALKGSYIIPDIKWLKDNVPEFSQVTGRITMAGRRDAADIIYDKARDTLTNSPALQNVTVTFDDIFKTDAYKELKSMATSKTGVPKVTEKVAEARQQFLVQVAQPFKAALKKKPYGVVGKKKISYWAALENGLINEKDLRPLLGAKQIKLGDVLEMRRSLDSLAKWGKTSQEIPEAIAAVRQAANSLRTATRKSIETSTEISPDDIAEYLNANDVFHHLSPIRASLHSEASKGAGKIKSMMGWYPGALNTPARATGMIINKALNDPAARTALKNAGSGGTSAISKMMSAIGGRLPSLPNLGISAGDSPLARLAGAEGARGYLENALIDDNQDIPPMPTSPAPVTMPAPPPPSPQEVALMQMQQQFPSMQMRPDGKATVVHPTDVQKLHSMTISRLQTKELDSVQASAQISAINAMDPVTGEVEILIGNMLPQEAPAPYTPPPPRPSPMDQLSEAFSQASPL